MSLAQADTTQDIDDLLDGTLDDLSDVPAFKPFARGAHRCKINFERKKVGGISSIEMKLTCLETMELTNPEDVAPAAGDTTNILFMLKKKDGTKNEIGEGQFKEVLTSLAPAFTEAKSNGAIMEAAENYECLVVTGIRQNKKDPQDVKEYTSIESVSII